MKRIQHVLLVAWPVFIILSGCSAVQVSDYAVRRPVLVPETFFDGHLTAHGVVKNRSGEVVRYFNAEMNGHWEGAVGTLEEDFVFDDGETQRRVWTLIRQDDRRYIGTAGDVIGEAKGEIAGNSMFLDYVLDIPYGDGTIHLSIDDRMYLVNPTTIVNESEMTKFGLRVGEVLLIIRKD